MLELNEANAVVLQISNDAFYYLLNGEDPLDDANLEEASEVISMFPRGYKISDNWKPIDNSDLIEAMFIPYTEVMSHNDHDAYYEAAKDFEFQIKLVDNNRFVEMWSFAKSTGKRNYIGKYELRYNEKRTHIGYATGNWRKGKGCLLWLKLYNEVKPNIFKQIPKDLAVGL